MKELKLSRKISASSAFLFQVHLFLLQVQSWARKATSYGFHLVPVPTFLIDNHLARNDPFTNAHYIPLDVTLLSDHEAFQSKYGILHDSYCVCEREIVSITQCKFLLEISQLDSTHCTLGVELNVMWSSFECQQLMS